MVVLVEITIHLAGLIRCCYVLLLYKVTPHIQSSLNEDLTKRRQLFTGDMCQGVSDPELIAGGSAYGAEACGSF